MKLDKNKILKTIIKHTKYPFPIGLLIVGCFFAVFIIVPFVFLFSKSTQSQALCQALFYSCFTIFFIACSISGLIIYLIQEKYKHIYLQYILSNINKK